MSQDETFRCKIGLLKLGFLKQGRLDMLPRLLHWLDLRAPVAEALHLGTGFAALAALAIAFTNVPTAEGQLQIEAGNTLRMTSEHVAPNQFEDRPVSVASLNFVSNEYTTPQALRVSNFGEAAYEMAKERRCLATGIYFEARSESHFEPCRFPRLSQHHLWGGLSGRSSSHRLSVLVHL
jgi:hypothetical protein